MYLVQLFRSRINISAEAWKNTAFALAMSIIASVALTTMVAGSFVVGVRLVLPLMVVILTNMAHDSIRYLHGEPLKDMRMDIVMAYQFVSFLGLIGFAAMAALLIIVEKVSSDWMFGTIELGVITSLVTWRALEWKKRFDSETT